MTSHLVFLAILLIQFGYALSTGTCEVPPANEISFCSSLVKISSPVYKEDGKSWSEMNTEINIAYLYMRSGLCQWNSTCDNNIRIFLCNTLFKKCHPETQAPLGVCQDACTTSRSCFMNGKPFDAPKKGLDACQKRHCNVDGLTVSYRPVCTDWNDDPVVPPQNITRNPNTIGLAKSGCPTVWINNNTRIEFKEDSTTIKYSHIYAPSKYLVVGLFSVSEVLNDTEGTLVHLEVLESNEFNITCRDETTEDNFIRYVEMERILTNGAVWKGVWSFNYNASSVVTKDDVVLELPPNSFKMAWNLTNWNFANTTNKIQYAIKANTAFNISGSLYFNDEDSEYKVYGNFTTSDVTYTYSFLRHVNTDGVYYEHDGFATSTDIAEALVYKVFKTIGWAISFPSFKSFSAYDPDFSVLFGGKPEETKDENGGDEPIEGSATDDIGKVGSLSSSAVAAIVVTIAIVAVIAIIIVGFMMIKKRKQSFRSKVTQMALSSNSANPEKSP